MIRTVFFDFSAGEPIAGYQFGGYEQEHGATTLQVKLPDTFLSGNIRFIHFDFQTSLNETVVGEPLTAVDGVVSTLLHQQLMQAGVLQFQVIARGEGDNIIAKSPIGKLIIEKSTYGDPVVLDEQPYRVDQQILENLALAQQAAASAEESKQALLARFPISGEDIADDALDLRHFSEAGYTLWRQMGLNGNGTNFLAITNEDPDNLYRYYFVGACPSKTDPVNPDMPAVINVNYTGTAYTVVGINGKPVAYKDIPLYGLYRFKGNSEVLLLDADQRLSTGEITTDKLANKAVTTEKLADEAVTSAQIAKKSIDPAHTTFVTPLSRSVAQVAGNFDFTLGSSDLVAVEGGNAYLLFEQYPPAYPDCLMLTLFDKDGGLLRRLPLSSLDSVSVEDMVYDHGRYILLPKDCAFVAMEIESPSDTPGLTMEVHYTLCRLSETLTIPYLEVLPEQSPYHYSKTEIDQKLGDIDTALDTILLIQAELIGGDA